MAFAAILLAFQPVATMAGVESWELGTDDASLIMRLLIEMDTKLDRMLELLQDDDEEEET
jgi:hypothetical protein